MESSPADELHHLQSSVEGACNRSPWGVDLIISAFVQALHSHRRPSVCTPFPTVLFTKNGDKDFAAVEAAVQYFPDIHMGFCSSHSNGADDVRNSYDKMPLESLKLLQWLLRLRYDVQLVADPLLELPRDLLRKFYLERGKIGTGMAQMPDYILKIQESEMRQGGGVSMFEEHKLHFGSILAFHGTSAENLHSILRCGLLILSNSTLQRNGAIFGEGIYLSTDPAVAIGFCKPGKGWIHSHFGERAKYLLLCEVAKGDKVLYSDSSNPKVHKTKPDQNLGTYIVVQNCELVKLRYVFVYVEPCNGDAHLKRVFHPTQVPIIFSPFLSKYNRVDWCKLIVALYVILILGIACLKFSSASKV